MAVKCANSKAHLHHVCIQAPRYLGTLTLHTTYRSTDRSLLATQAAETMHETSGRTLIKTCLGIVGNLVLLVSFSVAARIPRGAAIRGVIWRDGSNHTPIQSRANTCCRPEKPANKYYMLLATAQRFRQLPSRACRRMMMSCGVIETHLYTTYSL